jgi:hypothetical protein
MSKSDAPRRDLRLVSPLMSGTDVGAFQKALNGHLKRAVRRFACAPKALDLDGRYGNQTRQVYRWVGYYLTGFEEKTMDRGATIRVQHLIRDLSGLNSSQKRRAKERQRHLEGAGAGAVLEAERKYLDKREGDRNRSGPGFPIDTWEREVGMLGEGYCGIAQTYFIRHFGGVNVPSLAYVPDIYAWSRSLQHGMNTVPWEDRLPGDIVLVRLAEGVADHIGMLDQDKESTIEFDIDGGCYLCQRGPEEVVAVVRIEGMH